MLKPYPASLTTSDWVDYLVGLSREDQIAALATWHRRVEFAAKQAVLNQLSPAPPAPASPTTTDAALIPTASEGLAATIVADDPHTVVAAARDAALAGLSAPQDYWSS